MQSRLPDAQASSIHSACRTSTGAYHLLVSFDDNSSARLILEPASAGLGSTDFADWPSASSWLAEKRDSLPILQLMPGPLPQENVLWLEVVGIPPVEGGPLPGESWPVLRLREGKVELREGGEEFLPLARVPAQPRWVEQRERVNLPITGKVRRASRWLAWCFVALGTPPALALDVATLPFQVLWVVALVGGF